MNDNGYRARSERGEVQIGTWVTMIRTPAVLTLLQAAGLDFVRVDMEHSSFSMETVADMAMLARALDFPMVVRPPEGNREWITRLLDAGVWNLHIPQVDTPEQAAEVVALLAVRAARLARHVRLRPAHAVPHAATGRAHGGRQRARARDRHAGDEERLRPARRHRHCPRDRCVTIGPTDLAQDLGVLGTPKQRDVLNEYRRRLVEAVPQARQGRLDGR